MLSNAYKLRLSDDILRVKSLENLELNERNFMKIAISLDDLVILSFPEFREVHPSDLWTSEARGKFWFLKQIITKMELLLERIRNFVKEELGKPHFSWLVRVTHLFKLFLFPQPANPPTEWFSPDWLRRWGDCTPRPPFKHATALKWSGRSNWWDFCCPQHLKFSVRLVFIRIDVCVQLSLIFCGNVWVYFYRISIKGVL